MLFLSFYIKFHSLEKQHMPTKIFLSGQNGKDRDGRVPPSRRHIRFDGKAQFPCPVFLPLQAVMFDISPRTWYPMTNINPRQNGRRFPGHIRSAVPLLQPPPSWRSRNPSRRTQIQCTKPGRRRCPKKFPAIHASFFRPPRFDLFYFYAGRHRDILPVPFRV